MLLCCLKNPSEQILLILALFSVSSSTFSTKHQTLDLLEKNQNSEASSLLCHRIFDSLIDAASSEQRQFYLLLKQIKICESSSNVPFTKFLIKNVERAKNILLKKLQSSTEYDTKRLDNFDESWENYKVEDFLHPCPFYYDPYRKICHTEFPLEVTSNTFDLDEEYGNMNEEIQSPPKLNDDLYESVYKDITAVLFLVIVPVYFTLFVIFSIYFIHGYGLTKTLNLQNLAVPKIYVHGKLPASMALHPPQLKVNEEKILPASFSQHFYVNNMKPPESEEDSSEEFNLSFNEEISDEEDNTMLIHPPNVVYKHSVLNSTVPPLPKSNSTASPESGFQFTSGTEDQSHAQEKLKSKKVTIEKRLKPKKPRPIRTTKVSSSMSSSSRVNITSPIISTKLKENNS